MGLQKHGWVLKIWLGEGGCEKIRLDVEKYDLVLVGVQNMAASEKKWLCVQNYGWE